MLQGKGLVQKEEELRKAADIQKAKLEEMSGMTAARQKELMDLMEKRPKHDVAKRHQGGSMKRRARLRQKVQRDHAPGDSALCR